jgi:hypothetical protein
MRGFLYGLGAAAACSVGYAVITLATHMQLALISILVGYLIGRAVRIGSRGLGGLRCQILAVVLTYLAITTSYVPLVIQAMADQSKKEQAKKADPVKSDSGKSALRPSAGAFALGVVVITGIAIVSPFLALAGGTGGILGAIILAVGLMQAWKQTRRDERLLMGPYTLEERPALG